MTTPATSYESPGLNHTQNSPHFVQFNDSMAAAHVSFSSEPPYSVPKLSDAASDSDRNHDDNNAKITPVLSVTAISAHLYEGDVPVAPPLPAYAFRNGGNHIPRRRSIERRPDDSNDGHNSNIDNSKPAPEKKPGIGASTKSPMEMVLAEMTRRFKESSGADGELNMTRDGTNRRGTAPVGKLGGIEVGKEEEEEKEKAKSIRLWRCVERAKQASCSHERRSNSRRERE